MPERISVSSGAENAKNCAVSLLRLMKLYGKNIEYFLKPDRRPSRKSAPHAGSDPVLQKVLAQPFEGSVGDVLTLEDVAKDLPEP